MRELALAVSAIAIAVALLVGIRVIKFYLDGGGWYWANEGQELIYVCVQTVLLCGVLLLLADIRAALTAGKTNTGKPGEGRGQTGRSQTPRD